MNIEINKNQYGLSTAFLKHTAIVLMFINHFSVGLSGSGIFDSSGWFIDFQWYLTRASFILFAFLIAEGMIHTGSRKKYLLRLFCMSIASEFFFDELFFGGFPYWPMQNVVFTLFFGALTIAIIDRFRKKPLAAFLLTAAVLAVSAVVRGDYGLMGIAVIGLFYYLREKQGLMFFSVAVAIFALWFVYCRINCLLSGTAFAFSSYLHSAVLELHGVMAFPLIYLYNGRKGKQLPKEFYYLFYPGHLVLIIILIRLFSNS